MLLVLGGLTLAAAGFFGFFRQHVAVLPRIVLGAGGIIIVLAEEYSDWYRVVIIAVVMALLYYLPGVFAPARPPINALAAGPKE